MMSTLRQADASVRTPLEHRAGDFQGLRAFEHNWRRLERAAARGDALELAAASAGAGRACLTEGDLDEALWHVQRGLRFLDAASMCARGLALRCELAEIALQLAAERADDDEPAARRLREDTRDTVFEVVRQAAVIADRAAATAVLLHGAAILAALGDDHDAQTVRAQALRRPN